ncbi:hypothetical protein JCM1841_000468 [Sporobolomyces salmonicolor]
MDLDPAYFIHDPPSSSTPPSIPDLPLPPITLPALPPPSVSPHTTRVSFSGAQSGKMTSGLDLSRAASPMGAGYRGASVGAGPGPGASARGDEAGAGGGLEEDIARARMERASRRTRTLPTDLYSSADSNDSRDTASARQNILNLVNAGQQQLGSSSSSTPSLAMFMGGGAKARVHKVGTGMTEAEREETERLEREMAATRAKWGNKPEKEDTAPPAGVMSLASLMKGGATAGNAVTANVANRWQLVEQSPSSQPAPSPKPALSPSPASSCGQTPASRSVASAFGSTATGPRLNSPSSSIPPADDEGPARARPQDTGGLGVGIERASSLPSPSAVPAPSSLAARPQSPALVEPKVIPRSAPSSSPQPSEPTQNPKPAAFGIDALASANAALHTGTPPSSYTSPRLESPSKQFAAANITLTRLQSSNIVAERLKFAEQLQQPSAPASPSVSAQSSPTKADKRKSVLERWGRDSPNVFTGQGALKSQTLPSPGLPPSSRSGKPISSSPPPKQNQEELVETKSPSPVEPAFIGSAKTEEVPQAEVVAEEVAPKLVHITRDRARPSKSTPRTMSSAVATSDATPSEAPTSSFSEAAPTATTQNTPAPAAASPASLIATLIAPTSSYSKPTWSGAPIGVKEPSKPSSPWSRPEGDAAPERKYSRGVALPGLGSLPSKSPSPSLPPAPISIPSPVSSPTKSASEAMPASPGRPSVKAAAMRWGKAAGSGSAATLASMQALKQSYGVKVAPRTGPEPDVFREEGRAVPVEVRATLPAVSQPKLVAQPAAPAHSLPRPKPLETVKPAAPTQRSSSSSLVDSIVSLALSHSSSARLPEGETLSLDVFHLNSPTDNPHPIEHNHLFHLDEILGIVHRSESPIGSGEIKTTCFVWRGSEARETLKTGERIAKLGQKTGVEPVEIRYRQEPRALVEVFANQLTICRGRREDFNHLDKRLFSVQSHEDVVFVEEVDLSARNICSGYCSVFSLVGEVYAWLGEGSTPLEREACCDFAEAIADGRSVTVLAEGEETALFWHSLDGLEYASAHYWHDRAFHPQKVSLIQLDSASSASRIDSLAISDAHVSLLDGGFAEHWVVVPEKARQKKDELRAALEAAKMLASKFEERGFGSRTPFHVIAFPSLIPRDVPFLSRQLDFRPLNAGARPTRMNVLTAEEAREQLL